MPINGLGNLMGSPGGPRKPTWRWDLKNFFHGINFYFMKGATSVKKEAEKVFFLHKYHLLLFSALNYTTLQKLKSCLILQWKRNQLTHRTDRLVWFYYHQCKVCLFICLSVHHKPKPFFILQPLSLILQLLSFSACF